MGHQFFLFANSLSEIGALLTLILSKLVNLLSLKFLTRLFLTESFVSLKKSNPKSRLGSLFPDEIDVHKH